MSKQIRLFALRVQVKLNSQFKSKTATLLDNFAPAQHTQKTYCCLCWSSKWLLPFRDFEKYFVSSCKVLISSEINAFNAS